MERAETSNDNLIKALARAILALYVLLEKRFTVSQNVKKNGPDKSANQRQDLMPLVYESIKSFKRRTAKATASVQLDNEVLLRDFGVDIVLGEAKLRIKGGNSSLKSETVLTDERPAKFGRHGLPPSTTNGTLRAAVRRTQFQKRSWKVWKERSPWHGSP